MIETAQCPYCHEKLSWGQALHARRDFPEQCSYCFEAFTPEDARRMRERAEHSIGDGTFDFPGE